MHVPLVRPTDAHTLGLPPSPAEAASAQSDAAVSAHEGHQQSPFHLALGALNALPKTLLGWPLDASKTLLQTTPASRYPPPLRTLRVLQTTVREHGVRGLYKGVGGPAAGWACIDAGVLGGLWKARGWLYASGWREAHGADERLTIGGHVLAGTMAGLMVVPLAHPIDLVKNKVQYALRLPSASSTSSASKASPSPALAPYPRANCGPSSRPRRLAYPPNPRYFQYLRPPASTKAAGHGNSALLGFFTPSSIAPHSPPLQPSTSGTGSRFLSSFLRTTAPAAAAGPLGPFGTLAKVYSEGGLLRGVYHALPWTALCRGGMGILFGTYEVLLRLQERVWPAQDGFGKVGKTFVAGGLSSVVFWSCLLPADNVKAVLLTDSSDPALRRFRSSRSAIAHIYALSAPPTSGSAAPSASLVARALAGVRRLRPFWRGGGAVVARASVVNGVGLVLWEGAMKAVGERTLS